MFWNLCTHHILSIICLLSEIFAFNINYNINSLDFMITEINNRNFKIWRKPSKTDTAIYILTTWRAHSLKHMRLKTIISCFFHSQCRTSMKIPLEGITTMHVSEQVVYPCFWLGERIWLSSFLVFVKLFVYLRNFFRSPQNDEREEECRRKFLVSVGKSEKKNKMCLCNNCLLELHVSWAHNACLC